MAVDKDSEKQLVDVVYSVHYTVCLEPDLQKQERLLSIAFWEPLVLDLSFLILRDNSTICTDILIPPSTRISAFEFEGEMGLAVFPV